MTKKRKKKKSRIYIIWLMNLCLITAVVAFFVWYESAGRSWNTDFSFEGK